MLKAYVEEKGYNIYSSKQIDLPVPKYIIFYNGLEESPDREELRLSDLCEKGIHEEAALECRATVLNIKIFSLTA